MTTFSTLLKTLNQTKMPSKTIQEVIDQLTVIIETNLEKGSDLGLFPALYRKVTQKVKDGIEDEAFQDNERMEHLDVIFANRYLEAYQNFEKKEEITTSWEVAFTASNKLLYLQHLLLGMNAHINLDLGIAAAQTAVEFGQDIEDLHEDFNNINTILKSLVNEVQNEIGRVAPAMFVLDYFTKGNDEKFAGWAMELTRDYAWSTAVKLYNEYKNHQNDIENGTKTLARIWEKPIAEQDGIVEKIGHFIAHPSNLLAKFVIPFLKFLETGDTKVAIEMLSLDETPKKKAARKT